MLTVEPPGGGVWKATERAERDKAERGDWQSFQQGPVRGRLT
jgi:hypothetical protein